MKNYNNQISVIGCGRWGSFLAYYLANYCTNNVLLYGRETSKDFQQLNIFRQNTYLDLPNNVDLTSKIEDILYSGLPGKALPRRPSRQSRRADRHAGTGPRHPM